MAETEPREGAAASFDDVDRRASSIYEATVAQARSIPDHIDMGDGLALPGTRGQARAYYAGEWGVAFTRVVARRVWMRVDLEAIFEKVVEMATDGAEDGAIAYTYEADGWRWQYCSPTDEGAVAWWHCWHS